MKTNFIYDIYDMHDNILGVDRGTQYIGLAHRNQKNAMTMPIGYLMNDKSLFFNMSDVLSRYRIGTLVIGYPKQHKEAQKSIDTFIESISFIDSDITCIKWDEEYSSVVASATTDTYTKDEKEDTLAAMVILQSYLDSR